MLRSAQNNKKRGQKIRIPSAAAAYRRGAREQASQEHGTFATPRGPAAQVSPRRVARQRRSARLRAAGRVAAWLMLRRGGAVRTRLSFCLFGDKPLAERARRRTRTWRRRSSPAGPASFTWAAAVSRWALKPPVPSAAARQPDGRRLQMLRFLPACEPGVAAVIVRAPTEA